MRKWNGRLAKLIIVLLLLHAMIGSFALMGLSTVHIAPLAYLLAVAVMLHAALGGAATVSALKSGARGSRLHLRENSTFWIKRVTGVAILLMAFYHFSVYTGVEDGEFVLKEFTAFRMATQIVFVLVIFIHIFVSVKGMLVAGGVVKFRERMWDWILVLSIFMLFFCIAIVAYFITWKVTGGAVLNE